MGHKAGVLHSHRYVGVRLQEQLLLTGFRNIIGADKKLCYTIRGKDRKVQGDKGIQCMITGESATEMRRYTCSVGRITKEVLTVLLVLGQLHRHSHRGGWHWSRNITICQGHLCRS